jgi:uncharacterized membrane protein YeaQ/YmgE (transglycosylase-associated protein family)
MTILAWILIGVATGLLARVVMPVHRDGGNLVAVCVGVCSACVGGALVAIFLGGGVVYLNSFSVAWALVAALYTLFAYRCFATRGS